MSKPPRPMTAPAVQHGSNKNINRASTPTSHANNSVSQHEQQQQQRHTSASPFVSHPSHGGAGDDSGLISTSDGYAQMAPDGEIHVGRLSNSVVYRRRKACAAPLGRSTPLVPDGRYRMLPKEFVFGLPNKQDAEHADQLLHSWKAHSPPATKLQYDFGRDFTALNRHALAQRCTTPSEVRAYRHHHDARIKPKRLSREQVAGRSLSATPLALVAEPFSTTAHAAQADAFSVPRGQVDKAQMRPAGINSGSALPECRFAHAVGSASTQNSGRGADTASQMSSLVAHEYRYAWIAQKLTEHEDLMRAKQRAASLTPASASRRGADQGTSIGGGSDLQVGPSGRIVSHYPKTVKQRVMEHRAATERVHPKEYFTMPQFRDVKSRVFRARVGE